MHAPDDTSPTPADDRSMLRRLELAAWVEGATLLLLLTVAVPLKHLAGWPPGVRVMGPVHGLAFLAYLWIAIQAWSAMGWRASELGRLLILAVIPLGGFVTAVRLARRTAGRPQTPA